MADVSGSQSIILKDNDWTFEHIRTLVTWLNYSNVNMFLIDMSIKYYRTIITNIMAYTLLLSTISSTISISQLGISKDNQPLLYDIIQYSFIGASTFSTLLIGYVRLFKLQETLDANSLLYKSWLSFSTRISSEFQMPVHMRTSALELLQDMKNEYIDLFCKNPDIPFYVKMLANSYFQRNLNTTSNYTGKYRLCMTRPNYIKRTNVFFIFQDIIKNEIKRLSAELTPINYEEQDNEYDMVPSYYGNIDSTDYKNSLKKTRFSSRAIIEYKYDGPFIIIDVRDRDESQTFKENNKRGRRASMPGSYYNIDKIKAALAAIGDTGYSTGLQPASSEIELNNDQLDRLAAKIDANAVMTSPKRKTLLQRFRKSSDVIGGGNNSDNENNPPRNRRERQMSFSLPERSLIEQSCSRNTQNKSYYDMLEKIRKATEEIPLTDEERRQKMANIAAKAAAVASKHNIDDQSAKNSVGSDKSVTDNHSHVSNDSHIDHLDNDSTSIDVK